MRASSRKKKLAIFSGAGLALIIVIVFVAMKAKGNGNQPPKLPVKTGKAEVADIQVKVTEVGNVQPEVKVDVKSAVSGKVVSIFHRDGDLVKSGDVLARVEPDLNQAQSLADTKNALTSARIRYEQAKKNYEQDHNLFLQGLLATKQNRDSESEFLAAKQEFEKSQEKYNIVEKSGIPINQSPESFQGSNVVAPMDGTVLTKNIEIGESITSGVSSFNAGTVLFTVADVTKMIVKAGVNEVDIGKVHVGMPVKVTLDAYPKVSFAGRVDRIAPAVRLDDKVRVFDVEVRLDAQGRELRSGMTCVDASHCRRRKPAEEHLPRLLDDIRSIADGQSQADPKFQTKRLFTRISAAEVRSQLIAAKGYTDEQLPTQQTINTKLNLLGFRLTRVAKCRPQKGSRRPTLSLIS